MREHCTIPMRVCDYCGALFNGLSVGQRFCSFACGARGKRKRRPASPEDFSARFWSRVNKTDTCWLWIAGRSPRGYGKVRYNGKHQRANRVAWMMTHGPIPDGMYVCHTCDVPSCVRPDHLWLGSSADNLRDMRSKGRQRGPQGERCPWTHLTDEDVRVIRQRRAEGWTYARIGADFGLAFQTVAKIANRQSWTHVT